MCGWGGTSKFGQLAGVTQVPLTEDWSGSQPWLHRRVTWELLSPDGWAAKSGSGAGEPSIMVKAPQVALQQAELRLRVPLGAMPGNGGATGALMWLFNGEAMNGCSRRQSH